MSGTRIDVVLVKLGAVFVVVLSLNSLVGYVGYVASLADSLPLLALAFLFIFLIPFAIAALLWFFPATLLGKPSTDSGSNNDLAQDGAVLLAITLVGLYTLVFGFVDLFYFEAIRLVETRYYADQLYDEAYLSPDTIVGRYTNLFQILIGFGLLFGRRGLAQLVIKARGRGASAP